MAFRCEKKKYKTVEEGGCAIPCTRALRYACGPVNDTIYPFLTAEPQPEASFLERIGLVRFGTTIPFGDRIGLGSIPDGAWWKIILVLLSAWGLRELQTRGNIPDPFSDIGFSFLAMFVWGAYFFTVYSALGSFAAEQERAIKGTFNAITSYGHDLRGYATIEAMNTIVNSTYSLRDYPSDCNGVVRTRTVTGRQLWCEIADIGKTIFYAVGRSVSKGGIDPDRLPFADEHSRNELKYNTDDDLLSVMTRMLQSRTSSLVQKGHLPIEYNEQLTASNVGAANNGYGAVDGAKNIRPTRISNQFLMFFLFVFLSALVLIFPFSFFLDLFWVGIIAWISFGSLEIRTGEADVFNEDNRIADFQFREFDDVGAKSFINSVLSAFDGVNLGAASPEGTTQTEKSLTPGIASSSASLTRFPTVRGSGWEKENL